jgi:AraC-like DNA-binding protein
MLPDAPCAVHNRTVSRSTLAQIFREKTGIPSVEYVLRWRMKLAGRALVNSHILIPALGQAFRYDSDSAFSHAFRRIKGLTSSEYRKTMR